MRWRRAIFDLVPKEGLVELIKHIHPKSAGVCQVF